jgi:antitoxin FitA
MVTITVRLPDDEAERLSMIASRLHVSAEELVAAGVRDFLGQPEDEVQKAIQYVITKNLDLYKRLA